MHVNLLTLIIIQGATLALGTKSVDELLRSYREEAGVANQKFTAAQNEDNNIVWQNVFLRIASTFMLAVGRNIGYAESQTVIQGDDDEEEENDDDERSFKEKVGRCRSGGFILPDLDEEEEFSVGRNFVPGFANEPIFYTQIGYVWEVVGRALLSAESVGGYILSLGSTTPDCSIQDWDKLIYKYGFLLENKYSDYDEISVKMLKSQFESRLGSLTKCLGGGRKLAYLNNLIKLRLQKPGHYNEIQHYGSYRIDDKLVNEAISEMYAGVEQTLHALDQDTKTLEKIIASRLVFKALARGTLTYGRNMRTYPNDLIEVTDAQRYSLVGRSLLYVIFDIGNLRSANELYRPSCGADDLYAVLNKYQDLLYESPTYNYSTDLDERLLNFEEDVEGSISCLLGVGEDTPMSLTGKKRSKELEGSVHDFISLVKTRNNS